MQSSIVHHGSAYWFCSVRLLKTEIRYSEKFAYCQLAFGLVFKMILDILTRTAGGDAMTRRYRLSATDASIALLRIYNQIEPVPYEMTGPSRCVSQQQQLRPLLPTHTHTITVYKKTEGAKLNKLRAIETIWSVKRQNFSEKSVFYYRGVNLTRGRGAYPLIQELGYNFKKKSRKKYPFLRGLRNFGPIWPTVVSRSRKNDSS